jgi:hypothetical protein
VNNVIVRILWGEKLTKQLFVVVMADQIKMADNNAVLT